MKIIKKLDSPVIKGSIILLISFGIFNAFNFLFQFLMARMLSIEEYGILATLFSFIYISSVFTETIQTVMVKYSSGEENKGKLNNIIRRVTRKIKPISLILFVIYLIASIFLSELLEINYSLLAITGIMFVLAFFIPVTRGALQGRKKFKDLSLNMVVEASSKLFIALALVYTGIGVFGAIIGTIIGASLALVFSLFQVKDVLKSEEESTKEMKLSEYAKPSLMITAVVIIFCSLDVILAKIFFSAQVAGSYAIASVLGKIIFWGTSPISKAMLPFSSDNTKINGKKNSVLFTALLLLLIGIAFILIIFSIFPEKIISVFSKEALPVAIQILFYNGLAFSLVSISNLILLYKLSSGSTKGYFMLPIFLIIESILLTVFSDSVMRFTQGFVISSLIFLIGSSLILRRDKNGK